MINVPAWLNAIFIITGSTVMLIWLVRKIRFSIAGQDYEPFLYDGRTILRIGKNWRFWIDREKRSIAIRGHHYATHGSFMELYLQKCWHLIDCYVYETEAERSGTEYRLSFRVLWFAMNILVGYTTQQKCSRGEMDGRHWGFYFMDRRSFKAYFGNRRWSFDLPFVTWSRVANMIMSLDRKSIVYVQPERGAFERDEYAAKEAAAAANSEVHPYNYILKRGAVQHCKATIHVVRSIYQAKWTPFLSTQDYIDVRFDGEVGEGAGSFKGGVIGCSHKMKKGETPLQTLRRMEQEIRFNR